MIMAYSSLAAGPKAWTALTASELLGPWSPLRGPLESALREFLNDPIARNKGKDDAGLK